MTGTRRNMADTVRKLLAQAEDPATTEQEAQAFAARAAELMTRHALDAAVVRADKGQKPEAVTLLKFTVSGQGYHGKARASLVVKVAQGYGCEVATQGDKLNSSDRWVLIVGTASACKALELLLPSVIVQAEQNAFAKTRKHMDGKEFDTPANKNIARRDFFRSYLEGYGAGVGRKIAAARKVIKKEVADTPGALVLVTDADRISKDFAERFPVLRKGRGSKIDVDGYLTGQRDGQQADTGETKVKTNGNRALTADK